jgi:hypothetical protein
MSERVSLLPVWVIDAANGATWREVDDYPDKPPHLSVRVRFAHGEEGVGVAGIQVERTDGRVLTARDLRLVKLPPDWVLSGDTAVRWYQPGPETVVRNPRGPKGDDDEKHREVWDLYLKAVEARPRAPVRWMLSHLQVSDATARRWLKRARERAQQLGWPQPGPPAGE